MKEKLKIFTIFAGCLLFRLIPLRAPNIEPIMASIMPLGRRFGALLGFLFGFLSIVIYDALTHFGSWTWTAGITYGIIGVASYFYFKGGNVRAFDFALFAFFATITFDFITGVLFAPMFGQSLWNAFILQIPFTILHLAGNIGFAITLSPIIDKWLASKEFFAFSKKEISIQEKIEGALV